MSAFQPDKGIIHIIPTLILPTQPKVTLYPGKPTIPPVDTLAPGKPTDSPKVATTPVKFTATPLPTVITTIKITPRVDIRPAGTLVIYPAPTGLVAEALLNYNIVRLSWDQVPGAQGYKVYCTAAIDQDFTLVDPEDGDWCTPYEGRGNWYAFYDRRVMEHYTERYYKVSAVFTDGREGPQSNWVHVLALDPPPENFTAVALQPDMVLLSWSPSVGGADVYKITREGVGGSITWPVSGTMCIDGQGPSEWVPLQSDTEYRYQVVAEKNFIWQFETEWVAVRTLLETPNYVVATPISTSWIQITWNPVPGATGYKVYHSGTGDIYAYLGTNTTPVYNHSGLSADTLHAYKVVAYNDYGESAVSERAVTRTMLPRP
jgi:hypothetical protein